MCLLTHKAEDEEVFEEIRRLRLERGRLLQKIKTLEQQQQSALSALEEVLQTAFLNLFSEFYDFHLFDQATETKIWEWEFWEIWEKISFGKFGRKKQCLGVTRRLLHWAVGPVSL